MMNTQENDTKKETGDARATNQLGAAELMSLALQFCDLLLVCAPPFAGNSYGARVLDTARAIKPNLARMLDEELAKRKKA